MPSTPDKPKLGFFQFRIWQIILLVTLWTFLLVELYRYFVFEREWLPPFAG